MKGIHHVVYNHIRDGFQVLEEGEDNSRWFSTSEYLLRYIELLNNKDFYIYDKNEQITLVEKELKQRGF